jgi:predicted amidohydrolase
VPGEHKTEQWLALNAARAIENSVYVAGVCQAPPVSVGRSVLVDPMGVVEADLGLEPGVLAVEVSVETVERVRESFPMFRQRRVVRAMNSGKFGLLREVLRYWLVAG